MFSSTHENIPFLKRVIENHPFVLYEAKLKQRRNPLRFAGWRKAGGARWAPLLNGDQSIGMQSGSFLFIINEHFDVGIVWNIFHTDCIPRKTKIIFLKTKKNARNMTKKLDSNCIVFFSSDNCVLIFHDWLSPHNIGMRAKAPADVQRRVVLAGLAVLESGLRHEGRALGSAYIRNLSHKIHLQYWQTTNIQVWATSKTDRIERWDGWTEWRKIGDLLPSRIVYLLGRPIFRIADHFPFQKLIMIKIFSWASVNGE